MEKRKRVYPTERNHNRLICSVLLVLAFALIMSGVFAKEKGEAFLLQKVPSSTPVPLDESFDETWTEIDVELPEYRWYAIQTGVFENEETARQSALAFQKRGAAGYLWENGRFRVLASAYPAEQEAQNVREQLREQHQIDSYLYQISFPGVTLRLKGMQGQLNILQAAFSHVHELAIQLQKLSVALDRQEVSVQETVQSVLAMKTQMDIVSLRLRQRFVAPMPETVEAILAVFDEFNTFASGFSDDESAAAAGIKLKYQTFVTLWNIQTVYHTLNDT